MRRAFLAIALAAIANSAFCDDVVRRVVHESKPAVGTHATAAPGDVLYTEYEATESMFARLRSDAHVSQSGMTLPKGLLLECDNAVGSGIADCCKGYESALYCLQDRDHDGKLDKVKIVGGGRAVEHLYAPYDVVWQTLDAEPHWKKSLTYQGAAGGILHVTFQETGASEQTRELSFDIAKDGPTAVVYQGLRLSVSKADSTSIEYTVVSGFGEPAR